MRRLLGRADARPSQLNALLLGRADARPSQLNASVCLGALIDDADGGRARLGGRDPPGTVAGRLLGAREDEQ